MNSAESPFPVPVTVRTGRRKTKQSGDDSYNWRCFKINFHLHAVVKWVTGSVWPISGEDQTGVHLFPVCSQKTEQMQVLVNKNYKKRIVLF